jgi:hypothetical protein
MGIATHTNLATRLVYKENGMVVDRKNRRENSNYNKKK